MLYALTLSYLSTEDKRASLLDAHKAWLVEGFKQGRVIFAGPLSNGSGGFVLLHGENPEIVEAYIKNDPFVIHDIVFASLTAVEPALSAADFPAKWATGAKLI